LSVFAAPLDLALSKHALELFVAVDETTRFAFAVRRHRASAA
jgi:hypothetical protein